MPEFKMVDDNPAPADTCFVPYSKTVFKNKSWRYELLKDNVQYCCDPIEKELGTHPDQMGMPFIIFNSHYDHETQEDSCKLNILQAFPEEYDPENLDWRYKDIDFCPFCGKPIIVRQVKLFKEVVTGCEEVVQKVCKTDIVEVKS